MSVLDISMSGRSALLTAVAVCAVYPHAAYAQAVDGYGNPTTTAANTGPNYPFTSFGQSNNPYLDKNETGEIEPSGPFASLPATVSKSGEINQSASGYSYTNTTDPTDPAELGSFYMLEGNSVDGVVLENDGALSYMVLYKNYADGASLTNTAGATLYIDGNSVDGVTIVNDGAKMYILNNSALDGAITNTNGGLMEVNGNTLTGGVITNGSDTDTKVSHAIFRHNSANGIELNTFGNSVVEFYGNDAANAVLHLGAATTTIVGDCSVSVGCVGPRGTSLENASVTNAGKMTVSGNIAADEATFVNSGELLYTNAAISGTWDITNAATGTLEFANENDFNASIANEGAISVTSGYTRMRGTVSGEGTIDIVGGTLSFEAPNTYSGATTISGTLRADAVGVLSPNSHYVVNKGGLLNIADRNQTVGGLTNEGTVHMGTQVGTTLTVDGDYVGKGGVIEMNTVLGDETSVTDRVVILGDTSGTTLLKLSGLGTDGGPSGNGVKLIDVGGVSDGVFTIEGDYVLGNVQSLVRGAYAYGLYKGGITTPNDGDWYLRSAFQPGVPLYESYAPTLLSLSQLSTLQQRVGNRQWGDGSSGGVGDGRGGVWARISGTLADYEPAVSTSVTDLELESWKAQLGFDAALSQSDNGGGVVAGINGYYGKANMDVRSLFGDGRVSTDGYGVGATLTFYSGNGFYLDAQGQMSWFSTDLRSDLLGNLIRDNDGRGHAFSVELGKRVPLGGTFSLTPQVQTVYNHVRFDRFTDGFGADVGLEKGSTIKSRAGISVDSQVLSEHGGHHFYGVVNVVYEWGDGIRAVVANTPLQHRNDRLWGEVGVGGTYAFSKNTAFYFEVISSTGLKHFGESAAVTGSLGLRGSF